MKHHSQIDDLIARQKRGELVQYLQNHRGKPQFRPPPPVSSAVSRVLKPLNRKFGSGISVLKTNWADIVGTRLVKLSAPLSIRGDKSGRTLRIAAKGPTATILQANSQEIIQKANQFLGPGYIRRIRIQQETVHQGKIP